MISKFKDLKDKRPLLSIVLEECESFKIEDNVVHMGNAFFINSLITWCMEKRENNEISYEKFKAYMLLLHKYVKKEVDLWWKNGKLCVRRIAKHEKKGEDNASDNLESF
jgi:hypothetical protein